MALMLSADLQLKAVAVLSAICSLKSQVPTLEVDGCSAEFLADLELSNVFGEFDARKANVVLAYLADVVGIGER